MHTIATDCIALYCMITQLHKYLHTSHQCKAHMGSVREWVGARWRGLRNFLQRTKQQCGVDVWYCSEPLQHDATTQWDIAQKFALANCKRQRNNVKLCIYIKNSTHKHKATSTFSIAPQCRTINWVAWLVGWLVCVAVYCVAFCHWVAAIEYSIETNARACFILSSVLYCEARVCACVIHSAQRTNLMKCKYKSFAT